MKPQGPAGSGDSQGVVEFPALPPFIEATIDFVTGFARENGMAVESLETLSKGVRGAISLIQGVQGRGRPAPTIRVTVSESGGRLTVELLNRGVPIHQRGTSILDEALGRFSVSPDDFESIRVDNLGRAGQVISLGILLGQSAIPSSVTDGASCPRETLELAEEQVRIRELEEGEEGALSRLFYAVYGYNYINEFIYYPEKIRALISEGRLISIVAAVPEGRMVGHVGLMVRNENPLVIEPCLGVTDPMAKSKGLFSRLFHATMEKAETLSAHYLFFDFVTNHDLSQRLISRYGCVDLALFLGCQSPATQAKLSDLGLGADPSRSDRYSILYGVIPKISHPFGREVSLPENLGRMLGFLLDPLGMSWVPASRFSVLEKTGSYSISREPSQESVQFSFEIPGKAALESLVQDWIHLKKEGYLYAGVDVPLDQPGLGTLYEALSQHGFFVGGFIPYRCSDRLAIRFQAIGPRKVDFSEIHVFSEYARRLLGVIKENHERNVRNE